MDAKKLDAAAHEGGHLTVAAKLTGACTAKISMRPDGTWGGVTHGGPDLDEGDPIEWVQCCDIAGPCGEWLHKHPNCQSADVLAAIRRGELDLNESDRAHGGDSEEAVSAALHILRESGAFFGWATAELYAHERIGDDLVCEKLEEFDVRS